MKTVKIIGLNLMLLGIYAWFIYDNPKVQVVLYCYGFGILQALINLAMATYSHTSKRKQEALGYLISALLIVLIESYLIVRAINI